jgi:hypothetical protein
MGRLSAGDFVLADGKQFVVAKGFELGLEDIDHGEIKETRRARV